MTVTSADVHQAARLVSLALQPKLTAARDVDYGRLLRLYRNDGAFHALVEAVAGGLGLAILDATDMQLVVVAAADYEYASPFAYHLGDFYADLRIGSSLSERLMHGLIQVAIAAWCFPDPARLDDPRRTPPPLNVIVFERWLRDQAKQAAKAASTDPLANADELTPVWDAYIYLPPFLPGSGGSDAKPSGRSAAGKIRASLDLLADHGLMRKLDDVDGGTFQATARYRIHVRELAGPVALERLREAALSATASAAAPESHDREPDQEQECPRQPSTASGGDG
jgi:hypothetical protein